MSVARFPFGSLADGSPVTAWRIESEGFSVTLIDYGAAVQSLSVPTKDGKTVDVVLGYDTAAEYERNNGFLGATIGRVGNRIGGASFSLGGKTYRLEKNNGEHQLHGGSTGFDRRIWKGEKLDEQSVRFSRLSPDGEAGYPGNLSVAVTFTLANGALCICYDAEADADTIVNLTNHSYFNLNGGGTALNHTLFLAAERFTENDATCLPTGKILRIEEGKPFDFRKAKEVGRDIGADCQQLHNGGGYDHNFILSGAKDAAVLTGDKSGIRMTMQTDMPGVQFYSANNLDPRTGKGGVTYSYRDAVCLETQLFPNAMNCYGFPSPVLHRGEHLRSETVYAFETE